MVPLLPSKSRVLAQKLIWCGGSNTTKLAAKSLKEPDTSIGIVDVELPATITEASYSESRRRVAWGECFDTARRHSSTKMDNGFGFSVKKNPPLGECSRDLSKQPT